ncbi:histone transcription regulator 3 [Acrodontium crateriforme]|uniref:Histone transcription regulator 3 homolog n=1 Tax=Acrodontium crateriforme TaxID=150365 RepID=A0AAQ3MCR2_9PEZI|nr:histone transcription regulator 3 [Acrodontium crateriforme]
MSGFKALNIESDDESDVEIDDTKEIQIEDALKLYHNALKFHAEGPESFEKTAAAYHELFESDIFKYPESQPELRRIHLYGTSSEPDHYVWNDHAPGVVVATASLDTGPSTLPQILHLSHKNYAQFKMEYLTYRIKTTNVDLKQIVADASSALGHFIDALDKDDTDLDLWRRTATVGTILDSRRIARFCLEAVLEGDEEGLTGMYALPGLEEGLAAEQLQELVAQLQDQLSILQTPLTVGKRKVLSHILKQRLNTYETISNRQIVLKKEHLTASESQKPTRVYLQVPSNWSELGDTIIEQLLAEQQGTGPAISAPAVCFNVTASSDSKTPCLESPALPMEIDQSNEHETQWPKDIVQQFPGLDGGEPTAQPRIAAADPSMTAYSTHTNTDDDVSKEESPTLTMPSRKRSGDTAGINDGAEESRNKSRRIRVRESTADGGETRRAMLEANRLWELEQQINEIQAADDWVFETVGNLFERVGIVGFAAAKEIRQEMRNESEDQRSDKCPKFLQPLEVARTEISRFMTEFSDQLAQVLLNEGKKSDFLRDAPRGSSSHTVTHTAVPHSLIQLIPLPSDGLEEFINRINNGWFKVEDVAWEWLVELLHPNSDKESSRNAYTTFVWPESLKTMVVRVLINFDHEIQKRATRIIHGSGGQPDASTDATAICEVSEMFEIIFELHLDIFMLIKQPNSGVEQKTIDIQSDRLKRWAEIAREAMHLRSTARETSDIHDELEIRFLWATTFTVATAHDVSQEHVLECMKDLRAVFMAAGKPSYFLQNNAIMSELSIAALDKEVSRLTTKDFFLKMTNEDMADPVSIIESLEPLLELLDQNTDDREVDMNQFERPPDASPELIQFLRGSDMSVRLLLWQRLRKAYSAISFDSMTINCYLRMMRIVLDDMKTKTVAIEDQKDRQKTVLTHLSVLQDLTSKVLELVQSCDLPFEYMDENGLHSAVGTFGDILQLLQVFNVFEDSIRVGKIEAPTQANGLTLPTFDAVTNMIHNMDVHAWMIVYALLKEAMAQNNDVFPTQTEDKFDVLRCVHRNLGIRSICGASKRIFVRQLKDEFLHMTHVEGYDTEQAQVLYDLYGLNCFINPAHDLIEHDCVQDAFLDRGVAMQTVDLLLVQASKLPIKELIKHSLKDTIDKVHGALNRKRPSEAILRNREIYRAFLRSTINPMDIFDAFKGVGNELALSPVPKADAILASKGWYFLMGHASLTKFRSVKRTAPAPTEDVEIAIAFFMQDLEFSMDNWETWFRLAQAYDTKIEESVVWSAEKLNNNMTEVVQLQRMAIHCYTTATALAYRSAELVPATSEKLTELYTDFANRLYSTSRAPFNMLPFALDELDKFLSNHEGITRSKPFKPLRLYTAWKLSKVLYQLALGGNPRSWMLHFSLANCLWKMHSATEEIRGRDKAPSAQQVLNALIRAIELLPDKKESRDKKEPTLEPHYKLVSIVNKLVNRGELSLPQAQEALRNTPYARSSSFPQEMDEWVPHVLSILKTLRTADKSHWHHRMIARAAQIIYDDSESHAVDAPGQNLGALGAKHELTQQMFTKTMVLQVWRPECERAGRHFVYYARYIRFFVDILEQLKDRTNLEMLARRVRRRPHDVYEHGLVWQDICNAYLRLLRDAASIPDGLETSTFSNLPHEDFTQRKDSLEKWMQAQNTGDFVALDVLREVLELKKVNQSLMKPGPIDDLIGDSYAYLFMTVGKQLFDVEQTARRAKEEEDARNPPPVASPPRNPMMSLNHLMNTDGASDSTTGPGTADVVPAPRKKIGVGRREIRNCAEASAQKMNASLASARTLGIASGSRVEIVINRSRAEAAGEASADSSAPGSIHDSADDESELSELEEEDEDDDAERQVKEDSASRAMFPGLASSEAAGSREGSPAFETADEGENNDVEMDETHETVDENVGATHGQEKTNSGEDPPINSSLPAVGEQSL